MAGTVTYLGEFTVGGLVPAAGALFAAVTAQLENQLAGAIALQARLTITPPTLTAQIEICAALLASLKAAAVLGLPGVDFQVTACATLIANLRAKIALLAGFPLDAAGVFAYTYDGDARTYGPAVAGAIGSGLPGGRPDDHIDALIFATSIPATWAAMGEIFVHA